MKEQPTKYFLGVDLSGTEQGAGGVGGLLAVSIDGAYHLPCYDHNGNIVRYIAEDGTTSAAYAYDPFGNIIESSGTLADAFTFGFSTKPLDRETGLVSYQRRFHSPPLGRFLNRDPIEEEGGENLYIYANNAPSVYFDAFGKECTPVSAPVPYKPFFWRIAKARLIADVGTFSGITQYSGMELEWKLNGKIICCCNGIRIEKRIEKRFSSTVDFSANDIQLIVHNPLATSVVEVPNMTSLINAVLSLVSAVQVESATLLNSSFFDDNAISNLRQALKLAAPKTLDSGSWPENPCK